MAETTVPRTKRDGVWVITDGVETYTIAYEPGDASIDIPMETVNLFLDRGVIGSTPSIRLGDDQPITISLSAYLRDIASAAHATLTDLAVQFAGGYVTGNWTGTGGTNTDVTTWTVTWTVDGDDFGGSDITVTFTYVVMRVSLAEGDPDQVNISLTSYQLRPTFA